MSVRQAALAGAVAVLCAVPVEGQSLGDVARATEAKRKASPTSPLVFDERDVDPRAAGYEVVSYEITQERWRAYQAATIWVAQALEKDPALMERMTGLKAHTVRGFERFVLREPALVAALKAAGSNPHDYAYTHIAILAALVVHAQHLPPELKANLPQAFRANLDFVALHEQELKEMMTVLQMEMKARMGKAGGGQ
jgi:hypothetical protein